MRYVRRKHTASYREWEVTDNGSKNYYSRKERGREHLLSGTKIIFGDDELMVNCKSRERDYEVTLDVCKDTADGLTVGVNTEAREYVAQVTIPARQYEEVDTGEEDEDGKAIMEHKPLPFDMKKCTLTLWALI